MRTKRTIGAAAILGILGAAALGGCDIIVGIGIYCTEGKDPGCGGAATGGTGGTGGTTTSSVTGGAGGTTSSSAGGGTGGAPECSPPGAMQGCYDGPPATKGVGACTDGVQTCQQNGTWGTCDGDVLPSVETCASSNDEDCNKTECAIWSRVFGDMNNQIPLDVAVDTDGSVIVVGAFFGDISLDNTLLSAGAVENLFLLKFSADGSLDWGKSLGDSATQNSASVAVDGAGNVILAGSFKGEIDFGNSLVTNTDAATTDIFVAKFDPTGSCVWAHSYGDSAEQEIDDVAVDQLGDISIIGAFKGTVNMGKGNLISAGPGHDVLVAKLAANGTTIWNKKFGDFSTQFGRRVAVDSVGDLYVLGQFGGTINFGDGDQMDTTAGGSDIFLAKLGSAAGALVSKRILPSSSPVIPTGLAVDASGNVVIAADFDGAFDLGGVSYTPNGGADVLVANYDTNWSLLWSHQLGGGSANEGASRVALSKNGDVTVSMLSDGGVDFGGGALLSSGSNDVFLGKFSSTGQYVWSRHFGDSEAQGFAKIAAFEDGSIALACKISGTVNFGAGDMMSKGDDVVVAKLAP